MILDGDLSQIEWRCAAFLSQDKTMIQEIRNGVDIHTQNAIDVFGSEEYRQACKIFNFRLIYSGSPYAFFMDQKMPNFSLTKWEDLVSGFFKKYNGLKRKHTQWIRTVHKQGFLVSPTGRILRYTKVRKKGVLTYNAAQIVNYPVQSLATADITPLAMVVANSRMRKLDPRILFINQVHDSLIYDLPKSLVVPATEIVIGVFRELPTLIQQLWGFTFNVPLTGDVKVGPTWGQMSKVVLDS